MKHKSLKLQALFLLLALCPISYTHSQQSGWIDLFGNFPDTPTDTVYIGGEPYYNSFTDLFFINDDEGWVTSLQQNENQEFLIFHTQDGGQTWEIQKHWDYCHAIWMFDSENGYLGDHNGFIMVTNDGGDTWAYHGATGSPVTDISFAPGSDTGYVTTDESYYIWQITPAGVNQIDIGHLNYWSGISATDEAVWFCGGIQVFYWDPGQQSIIPEFVNHCGYFGPVFFIDKDHGWIGNLCEIRGFVDYDYYWPEIHSTDQDAITCLHAIDTNRLWATTFDGMILHTTNAWDYGYIPETNYYWSNVVWEEQPHPKSNELLGAIMFTSQNCGYACGNNNTILKYTVISGLEEQGGMEAGGQGGVEVFPNPGRGIYSLQFSNYNLQSVRVEIVDLYGKAVTINNNRTIEQLNDSALEIDITNLPSGIYIIRIHLVNQIIVKKIIKL